MIEEENSSPTAILILRKKRLVEKVRGKTSMLPMVSYFECFSIIITDFLFLISAQEASFHEDEEES